MNDVGNNCMTLLLFIQSKSFKIYYGELKSTNGIVKSHGYFNLGEDFNVYCQHNISHSNMESATKTLKEAKEKYPNETWEIVSYLVPGLFF